MKTILIGYMTALICTLPLAINAQVPSQGSRSVPIYSITVTERTTKAINYAYRSLPTKIDFRGTLLMPKAKGEATVESKRGRTEIDVKFENLAAPTQFGREYLTYVLWAITPEGAPHNIGEVVANASDKAKLHVTTELQAFGLIVTAEPYSATRRPGDVVVLENEVRPDTVGKIQEIQAKYELMPRGHYTWVMPDSLETQVRNAPKVSMDEYEAQLELYEAQNALQIARAANAGQYAPHTLDKAEQLFTEAQRLHGSKTSTSLVVQNAREAAQTAEDARMIAERQQQEEKLTAARVETAQAQQAKVQAEANASRAMADANAARSQANAERIGRERAEADAAQARQQAAQAQAMVPRAPAPESTPTQASADTQKSEFRMRLLEQLNGVLPTRDTPRGMVVTMSDPSFERAELRGSAYELVGRVAAIIAANPGLQVQVEGHTDSPETEALSWKRAEAVSRVMESRGMPRVSARGFGNSRLLTSNASPAGREQNRRVEIVISGDPIGTLPFWDRTYSLMRR